MMKFEKVFKSITFSVPEECPLQVSRLDVANRKSYTQPSEIGNSENSKFSKILKLVKGLTIKFDEISSLARISLPCGAPVRISSVSSSGCTVEIYRDRVNC